MFDLKDEPGSVSAFVVGLILIFIACAGLAVDGGRVITAKVRVSDQAENAARVGAQAVTDIRLGVPTVDRPSAIRLVRRFLASSGAKGSVSANRIEVCVTVEESVHTTLLALIGVGDRHVGTERCARPVTE